MHHVICNMILTKFQTRKTTNGVLQWTPLFQWGQHVSRSHRSKWFHSRMKRKKKTSYSGLSNYHLSLLKLTQMSDVAKWRKMDLQQPCVTRMWNITVVTDKISLSTTVPLTFCQLKKYTTNTSKIYVWTVDALSEVHFFSKLRPRFTNPRYLVTPEPPHLLASVKKVFFKFTGVCYKKKMISVCPFQNMLLASSLLLFVKLTTQFLDKK